MDEFKLTPVKSKPRKTIARARKGAGIKKGVKTCFDCPSVIVLGRQEGKEEKGYTCKHDKPREVKIVPKLMSACIHNIKPYAPLKADYIQQAYLDAKKWRGDK